MNFLIEYEETWVRKVEHQVDEKDFAEWAGFPLTEDADPATVTEFIESARDYDPAETFNKGQGYPSQEEHDEYSETTIRSVRPVR